jgi:hypothetical protein
LLRKYEIDVSFLWSICPETYSFTLYESWAAGCTIVTNPVSGNIALTVEENSLGEVFQSENSLFRYFENVQSIQAILNRDVEWVEFKYNDYLPKLDEQPKVVAPIIQERRFQPLRYLLIRTVGSVRAAILSIRYKTRATLAKNVITHKIARKLKSYFS